MEEVAIQTVTDKDERVVDLEEKALVSDWNKRIAAAISRTEKVFSRFQKNRKLLSGDGEEGHKALRSNLHFANMASMLPQIYAKDPEFSVAPTAGVDPAQIELIKRFADTAEKLLTKCLVRDAKLKKQSKKLLRSAFVTSIGWWKLSWQESRKKDPLILNQIKDTQDNIDRLELLSKKVSDNDGDHDLQIAKLREALAGLETQTEITVARGLALDFVMSEDILVMDESIRTVTDYQRASAMGHRVWMTPEQYELRFGYKPKKAKSFMETNGVMGAGTVDIGQLHAVWEIWSQDDNRIYYVCEGEEGFAEQPKSPDWTGKQWYPFFGAAFNEIDGRFYPLSDIELTEALVAEYNETREDFVKDRKGSLPLNIARKGGSLTPADMEKIKNRGSQDIIMVEGVGNQPISNDIFIGQLSQIKMENYSTDAARADMEMILGGGDASRGSVMKAKTATEAEILSQGLRGRSAERQDIMEDVLNELAPYALEILLRKMTPEEVKAIVGEDAEWPQLSIEEIFNMVSVEVRGGSTGKPDHLQEQDRWTKLLPIIQEAIQKVSELRQQGQEQLAQAVIHLTRETLRRFDERLDIEQFLPPAPEGEDDPAMLKQQNMQLKQQLQAAAKDAKDAREQVEKGYVSAAASIATSANPLQAAEAFGLAMQYVQGVNSETPAPQVPEIDPAMIEQARQMTEELPTTTAPMLQ